MKPVLALVLVLSLQAGASFAHAGLVSATPAGGATAAAPSALTLTFSEKVTLKFSGITLTGADGEVRAIGEAGLSADGLTLTIPAAAPLTAGTYAVDWHALADDGHKSHGRYTFTVK